jgi:N-acetyl sugar amidotransferase
MDSTVEKIFFNDEDHCNFCVEAKKRLEKETYKENNNRLENLLKKIKKSKSSDYDCVIGISGGVDSSYVAAKVKELGLNPLAVHLDNGWNSDLANSNINSLLDKLQIDLITHVIDWEEFKNLQVSFLKSSIANAEIPTDHAIGAILYKIASEHNIKYILHGGNIATESIMPKIWMEDAFDLHLLRNIQKKHGSKRLRTYPTMGYFKLAYFTFIKKIRYVGILNYISYNKDEAIKELEHKFSWKKYEAKHFESIFTRWFQGFYLPKKYGIDKRLAHFSSLIISGQLSRDEAMKKMSVNSYSVSLAKEDTSYVKKKLEIGDEEFLKIINDSPKSDLNYSKTRLYMQKISFFVNMAKNIASDR